MCRFSWQYLTTSRCGGRGLCMSQHSICNPHEELRDQRNTLKPTISGHTWSDIDRCRVATDTGCGTAVVTRKNPIHLVHARWVLMTVDINTVNREQMYCHNEEKKRTKERKRSSYIRSMIYLCQATKCRSPNYVIPALAPDYITTCIVLSFRVGYRHTWSSWTSYSHEDNVMNEPRPGLSVNYSSRELPRPVPMPSRRLYRPLTKALEKRPSYLV